MSKSTTITDKSVTGTALLWFRRDLRLSDNPALRAALDEYSAVVPLYVWDERLVASSGAARLVFLRACVDELDRSLDGALVSRRGQPADVVAAVAAEVDAPAVFCSEDFGPYGVERDRAVSDARESRSRRLVPVGAPYAVAPGSLFTSTGGPFQVFTPFRQAWRSHGWDRPLRRPNLGGLARAGLKGDPPPELPDVPALLPEAGEAAAHRRLDRFVDHAARYRTDRDRPAIDGTSRLSPYLRFGLLHPRQILARLDDSQDGHRAFESELCWREFYADVLFHRPASARQPYRPEWAGFEYDTGPDADDRFRAWAEGRTGYPIVDAGMRQLLAEGWMHNRVRMIVASFLVKDLHLDWRRGARWFMAHLVDGDLASNQHGWQWVAGSGTDAAPYFRIFNPVTQGQRFDPDGGYVRRWVPELRPLDAAHIHQPWAGGTSLFGALDYPSPIVEHSVERQESLARYARLKAGDGKRTPVA